MAAAMAEMAAVLVLTPDEEAAAMKLGGTDLVYLFGRHEVNTRLQALFFHSGVKSLDTFAHFAKDVSDLQSVMKDSFGLDPATSLDHRAQASAVICAWNNAKTRSHKAAELEAEMEVRQWTKPVSGSDYVAMRSAFEAKFWKMDDRETPSKEYLEKKLEDLESGELRAESLTEVVSKDEVEPDALMPVWDKTGNLSVRKGSSSVPMPSNPEGLRRRLTIMANAMIMLALRHTNRREFTFVTPGTFEKYKAYLLGEFVLGLTAKNENNETIGVPPWPLVLSYEHAIRKRACQVMNNGGFVDFALALRHGWGDCVTKERFFSTPLSLTVKMTAYSKHPNGQARQQDTAAGGVWQKDKNDGKASGKGKGKRKGKDKGGKAPGKIRHRETVDKQGICFKFNNKDETCKGKCNFVHCCSFCFGNHASYNCTGKVAGPVEGSDTQVGTKRTLKVLYLFAGGKRKQSVKDYLLKLAKGRGFSVEVTELDICRQKTMNFARLHVRQIWLSKISAVEFDSVLSTPPCSSFTRAMWANKLGPSPMRSYDRPKGFPWLQGSRKLLAEAGSVLADFSFAAVRAQAVHAGASVLMEQPEDLGAVKSGPWPGQRPASMWQNPQHSDIAGMPGMASRAFHQHSFGTDYPKPTRFLVKLGNESHPAFYDGLPQFDSAGNYTGPLPRCSGASRSLVRKRGDAGFKTTGTADWPPQLCEWVAQEIISFHIGEAGAEISQAGDSSSAPAIATGKSTTMEAQAAPAGDSTSASTVATGTGTLKVVQASSTMEPKFRAGFGSPRQVNTPGKRSSYHDGAGLASPGRWDPDRRRFQISAAWVSLRKDILEIATRHLQDIDLQRTCWNMAVRKQAPFQDNLVKEVQDRIAQWCVAEGSSWSKQELLPIADGQPFLLKLLSEVLRLAGDPDWAFLLQAETGLPAGITVPLPRTPEVYEEQTPWRLDLDAEAMGEEMALNYSSVDKHKDYVYKFFDEEVLEGLMIKMARAEFDKKYQGKSAIAALAVLFNAITGKLRIIHDATNKVRVNNRIKCLDKQRMPGAKEKFYILHYYKSRGVVLFSVLGDVSKAHRRFKYLEVEHGFLACQVDPKDDLIYVNKVGTFGVGSASYWWGRIFGASARATYQLLGPENPAEILVFADDIEVIGPDRAGRRAIVLTYLFLVAFGNPFKWEKQRGGLKVDWIGLHTDYTVYKLGISEERCAWLVGWCTEVEVSCSVWPRVMAAGLGRLCYTANALFWERPFLGPIYAWVSSVGGLDRKVAVPWAIKFILSWIASRLRADGRLQEPPSITGEAMELFRSDAKAEGGKAWIGAWETRFSLDPKKCRWFYLEVTRGWAPWAFSKKDPNRVIAALELLGNLAAIMVFGDSWPRGRRGKCIGTGISDNLGNTYIVAKGMTTKYPITLILMEVSEQLRSRGMEMSVTWKRRDENQEADDLTNLVFDKFSPELEVKVDPLNLKWLVLPGLMKSSELLRKQIVEGRASKGFEAVPTTAKFLRKKLLSPW
ncbi:unnamed protein product [Polarella glacialis]|uniref:Uncharacterized protein n=1 Tax=Polarella glacialis TaxID=89957 RepID=A0A813KI69_POLGL|nr:unnamed protein product [Polarella glacialis]